MEFTNIKNNLYFLHFSYDLKSLHIFRKFFFLHNTLQLMFNRRPLFQPEYPRLPRPFSCNYFEYRFWVNGRFPLQIKLLYLYVFRVLYYFLKRKYYPVYIIGLNLRSVL